MATTRTLGASHGYGYDAVGNMTSKTINGVGTTMQSNVVDQVTAAGNTAYSYDLNGNQLSSTNGHTLAYNSQDQSTSITPSGGSSIPLTYTGPGQAERTGNGSTSYQDDNTGLSAVATSAGTTSITNGPNGELMSERVTGRGTYYYLFDGLGSVVGLTDSSGNLVNTYSYDPYGNSTSKSEQVPNPFQFTGALLDSSTGLYKLGERYYDPSIGRFTQRDPAGTCGLNTGRRYSYANDDPVDNVDPSRRAGKRKNHTRRRTNAYPNCTKCIENCSADVERGAQVVDAASIAFPNPYLETFNIAVQVANAIPVVKYAACYKICQGAGQCR